MVAGWVRRKEERRWEGVEVPWTFGPAAARLVDDEAVEGRVDVWTRLEEFVDGTCEVGAVELRLVEGLWDVVGRVDVCGVVEL